MTILIIGTPDSGKSQKAEAMAVELAGPQKKYYIATMIPYGEEGARRVEKHRKLRAGKGFETIEKTTAVHELVREIPDLGDSTCLLECMSNLIGNEMHDGKGERDIVSSVMELAGATSNLIIVTNSFPMEDEGYDKETKNYVKLVGLVNGNLSQKVDKIYQLIEGEWNLRENT